MHSFDADKHPCLAVVLGRHYEDCTGTLVTYSFLTPGKLLPQLQGYKLNDPLQQQQQQQESSTGSKEVWSMFPIENEELLYTRWEDKVIWDATVRTMVVILSGAASAERPLNSPFLCGIDLLVT